MAVGAAKSGSSLIFKCSPYVVRGDAVFLDSEGILQKANSSDITKMPAVGIVQSKLSETDCFLAPNSFMISYEEGLNQRKTYFVDNFEDGKITDQPPCASGEILQKVGFAVSEELLSVIVSPEFIFRSSGNYSYLTHGSLIFRSPSIGLEWNLLRIRIIVPSDNQQLSIEYSEEENSFSIILEKSFGNVITTEGNLVHSFKSFLKLNNSVPQVRIKTLNELNVVGEIDSFMSGGQE